MLAGFPGVWRGPVTLNGIEREREVNVPGRSATLLEAIASALALADANRLTCFYSLHAGEIKVIY
jgi:hypothetical protein